MLLHHTALYAIGRGLPGVINFLTIALYTRLLMPDDYGFYALVISAVGLFNAMIFEWLRLSLLRFREAAGERPETLFSTLLAGFIGGMLIAAAGSALVAAFWLESSWLGFALLSGALLCSQAWYDLNLDLVRAQFRPIRYGLMTAYRAIVGLAVGLALIMLGFEAVGALLGVLVGLLVASLQSTLTNWRGVSLWRMDWHLLKQLLAYGLPLTASFLLAFVVSASDRFLIAWLLGPSETGIYAAGYDMVWHTLTMLMLLVHLAGYPLAVRALEKHGVEAARQQVRQTLLLLTAVGLPAAAGIAVCATTISGLVLGEAFRTVAVDLIPWVALGVLLARLKAYYVDMSFHLGRNTVNQIWVMGAAAALNVALNLWLIPLHGIQGAIYATVVSYAVAFALGLVAGRGIFPLPAPSQETIKVVAATALMVAALWPFRQELGLDAMATQVGLGCAVYGLTLLVLNFANCRNVLRTLMVRRRRQPA